MNSEKKNEIGTDNSNGRAFKIREAAPQIAQQKLGSDGYHLVVRHRRDELARLLIKIRRGEAGFETVRKFFHQENGSVPETKF